MLQVFCRLHISVFFTPNLHRQKTAALFVAWFLFTRWKCQEPDWGSDSRKQTIDTITTSVPKKVWLFRSPNKKAGNHLQKPQKPSRGDLQNIPKWESDQSLANFEDADSGRNIGPLGKYWFYRSRRKMEFLSIVWQQTATRFKLTFPASHVGYGSKVG